MPPGYIPTSSQSVINEAVEGMMKVVAGGSAAAATFVSYILLSGAHRTSTAVTKRHNREHLLVARCGEKNDTRRNTKKKMAPPEAVRRLAEGRPPKAAEGGRSAMRCQGFWTKNLVGRPEK